MKGTARAPKRRAAPLYLPYIMCSHPTKAPTWRGSGEAARPIYKNCPPVCEGGSGRIPIVNPVLMYPVERGFAASLARPGGRITGFTLMHAELNAKRLELLRTAFPQVSTVSALVDLTNPSVKEAFEESETAARSLGLGNVRRVEAENAAALGALRPEVFSGTDAVVVVPVPPVVIERAAAS